MTAKIQKMDTKFAFYRERLRSADKATIIYQVIILLLIALFYNRIPYRSVFIPMHFTIIIVLSMLPKLPDNIFVNWLRYWNPLIFIPANFYELHFIVPAISNVSMDQLLQNWDFILFGLHPTLWVEQFNHPILTEYLQLCYTLFYFLPLILAIKLYRRNELHEFDYFSFIIVCGFYLSYLGYFLIPALGPRIFMHDLYSAPLGGVFLAEELRTTLEILETRQYDVFPSGHTIVTLLTMFYAMRYYRRYGNLLLIIGSSLIVSTVYLRYHYVVDIIAGLFVAVALLVTGRMMFKKLMEMHWEMDFELLKKYAAKF
ncbi:MAG: phosphatase PAP2 family protein [Caldithrix sp.]|nr:phosphatase PAP2 family protein [Caldithrix sp.]